MKKLILSAAMAFTLASSVSAQYTTPRTGTGVKYDLRKNLTAYATKTDAASATIDTFTVVPNAYSTVYRLVLVDSVCAGAPTLTNCYAGDRITFVISAASGTPFMRFVGSDWITAGTVTMTTRLRSVVNLIFDGAKWVESGRYTQ